MSVKLFDDHEPFDYQTQNFYNAQRSPSTVHCKNSRLRKYFRKYLLERAISVFVWKLPEHWNRDYFLYTLYGCGYLAVFDTDKFGVLCQGGALGGYDVFYAPKNITVTNPLLPSKTYTNEEDCIIIKLQPDYSSILDIVGFYADQLALASESMGINLVNIKTGTVFGAGSKAQAESYKKMYDSLNSGEPAVVVGNELLDEEGKPTWFPFTQNVKQSYVVSDILSDMRKIVSMFDSEIGIPNANTDKRERLIEEEINSNNVETYTLCELWLERVKEGFEKANAMFKGLNLSVDWRVKPDYNKEEKQEERKGG